MKYHDDPNEIIPTPAQQRKAMKRSMRQIRNNLDIALNHLDAAKAGLKDIGAPDEWVEPVDKSVASVEDLRVEIGGEE